METRKVSLAEFHAELKAQGVPREHVALKCFMCDTVQSITSLIAAGAAEDSAEGYFGFSCIGRFRRALSPEKAKGLREGCDWTIGGLLSFSPYIVVTDDGVEHKRFPPASPAEAQSLKASIDLADFYSAADAETWLNSQHQQLHNARPIDLLGTDRAHEVFAVIEGLRSGAYQ